jgi:excisionase family DNA binding protein
MSQTDTLQADLLPVESDKERYTSSLPPLQTTPSVTVKLLLKRAKEHSITLNSLQEELTTQQTADVMGVSQSHIVNLLDAGKIPFCPVGIERYVRFQDLLKYVEDYQREANDALDTMTSEAQEWGLYE